MGLFILTNIKWVKNSLVYKISYIFRYIGYILYGFRKLCKYLGVKIISPSNDTRITAVLDCMICGKNIRVLSDKIISKTPSDHSAVRWEIEVNFPTRTKQLKFRQEKLQKK